MKEARNFTSAIEVRSVEPGDIQYTGIEQSRIRISVTGPVARIIKWILRIGPTPLPLEGRAGGGTSFNPGFRGQEIEG